jgi:hypothetical protein
MERPADDRPARSDVRAIERDSSTPSAVCEGGERCGRRAAPALPAVDECRWRCTVSKFNAWRLLGVLVLLGGAVLLGVGAYDMGVSAGVSAAAPSNSSSAGAVSRTGLFSPSSQMAPPRAT